MKILDEEEMSYWAFWQCKNGNDIPEIRNLITSSHYIYLYCIFIKDDKDMIHKMNYTYYTKYFKYHKNCKSLKI